MAFSDTSSRSGETTYISTNLDKDLEQNRENAISKTLKFKCYIENCVAAYRKKWLLEEHIRKHNKERPFVCTILECLKSFTKESHLTRHKVMVHEKACEIMCDVIDCGKVFNNKYSLKKHKNKVHIENSFMFCCNECSKRFNKKWKLNQHMYIHTGETPFKCFKCNLGFILERDLTKHNRNHKNYTCNCGEIFERWSLLRLHKKDACLCIDKKCKNCGKLFTQKHNLSSHYKTCNKNHENFQCPYMDCTRIYLHKRNLNWHIANTHEKNKTQANHFKCTHDGCEKAYSKKCFLNRHLKSHDENFKLKPKKPRAPRKDKGMTRTYIAATLSGIKLSQKEHREILNGNIDLLTEISEEMPETKRNISVKDGQEIDLQKNTNPVNDSLGKNTLMQDEYIKNERGKNNLEEHIFWKVQTVMKNNESANHNVKMNCTFLENEVPLQSEIDGNDIFKGCNVTVSKIEKCQS